MSIYCSSLMFSDDDHTHGCAFYVEDPPGSDCYEISGRPCDCGIPTAPLIYQGSHVLPSDSDSRGGDVEIADIPDFIRRDGRDDGQGTGLKDWIRLTVVESPETYGPPQRGLATVVLTREQAGGMRDWLTTWLDREPLGEEWS